MTDETNPTPPEAAVPPLPVAEAPAEDAPPVPTPEEEAPAEESPPTEEMEAAVVVEEDPEETVEEPAVREVGHTPESEEEHVPSVDPDHEPADDPAAEPEAPPHRFLLVKDTETGKVMNSMDVTDWGDANIAAAIPRMQAGLAQGLRVVDSANEGNDNLPAVADEAAEAEEGAVDGEAHPLAFPPAPDGWERIQLDPGVAYYPVPQGNGTIYSVWLTEQAASQTLTGVKPAHLRATVMMDPPGRSGWVTTDEVYEGTSEILSEAISMAHSYQSQHPDGT